MTDSILPKLATFVATEILKQDDRELAPDEPLISGGLIDSFHLVDLALFVEEEFGVRIEDFELNADTFDTLAQLAALIEERRG
ncbi:MAG TPA: acyl carrier protein [Anaerolineae bacterium]|nr:acyl carrier protein [Anaerolineae bacterium]